MKKSYVLGDKLKCIRGVNSKELEMTNPNIQIEVGDTALVADYDEVSAECSYVQLVLFHKQREYDIIAYNDYPDHPIVDECFEKIEESEP